MPGAAYRQLWALGRTVESRQLPPDHWLNERRFSGLPAAMLNEGEEGAQQTLD